MAVNDFNRIAPIYDQIAHLVFGDRLLKAQTHFLDQIKPDDKVLILGGGTGALLEYLPICKQIHYVEKSDKMIQRARKRNSKSEVQFINQDFLAFKSPNQYDVILCPFFLDCFAERKLETVLHKVSAMIAKDGWMMIADFDVQSTSIFLSQMMHLFFRLFASLGSSKLLDIRKHIVRKGFDESSLQKFKNGIFSTIYKVEQ
ncbi:class I SAM-dependent methyltransferase [Ekhidna sp.]